MVPAPVWLDASWRNEALEWIDRQLDRLGRPRTGALEQPHVRPWSTVILVPTGDGPAWFKASGPGTAYEPRLLEVLARWRTPMLLEPLAIDLDRGWLLLPDGGTRLRERIGGGAGIDEWRRILPEYAAFQRGLAPRAETLIGLGVPDLRPAAMPGLLEALLQDTSIGLPDAAHRRLRAQLPRYVDWCAELAAVAIAPTLQHDDLHDGNIFVGEAGDRIFDWGDAVIAHPFGTLLATLRSVASRDASLGRHDLVRLRDAYLEPWTADHSRDDLARTVQAALRVGTVGRALAWRRALADVPPGAQGEYRGAVVDWLLEMFEPTVI